MILKSKVVAIFLVVGIIGVLAGCCGGDTVVEKQPVVISPSSGTSPTVGQELQDLEEAYKKGVINKSQYEEAKKKILDGAGK